MLYTWKVNLSRCFCASPQVWGYWLNLFQCSTNDEKGRVLFFLWDCWGDPLFPGNCFSCSWLNNCSIGSLMINMFCWKYLCSFNQKCNLLHSATSVLACVVAGPHPDTDPVLMQGDSAYMNFMNNIVLLLNKAKVAHYEGHRCVMSCSSLHT